MLSQILYEDGEIIIVHKPAGIAVQTARVGQQDVVSELKNYLRRGYAADVANVRDAGNVRTTMDAANVKNARDAGNVRSTMDAGNVRNTGNTGKGGSGMPAGRGEPYLGIIHRLDQPVEGILVFAKTKASAASLTAQLQKQGGGDSFCKQYYAVLCGIPADREARLSDYLYKKMIKNGKYMDYKAVILDAAPEEQHDSERETTEKSRDYSRNRLISHDATENTEKSKARRAVLEYRILQVQEQQGLALADITILTGRFHQIRAQMAHAGTPLLGDVKYGTEESKALAQRLGIRNVALCASRLSFIHPVSEEKMDFQIKPENPAFSSFSQL